MIDWDIIGVVIGYSVGYILGLLILIGITDWYYSINREKWCWRKRMLRIWFKNKINTVKRWRNHDKRTR